MKYVILVGDGMADIAIPELNGKTPVEHAHTPNMDSIAKKGRVGLVKTVPEGFPPGSDVANMSLLGYDPKIYFTGRSPIEAASLGIDLKEDDTAFRCNLVNINDGIMCDYSSGHIETEDSVQIIEELQKALNSDTVKFYKGVSYRHTLVIKDFPENGEHPPYTPPHDISDQKVESFLPKEKGSDLLLTLMAKAKDILKNSEINKKRISEGKTPVTDIWLWGEGKAPKFVPLQESFGITGSVVSAVDLVKGLGKLAGLKVRKVEGATGYLGTNYKGKLEASIEALENEDFVYLHVEAPDETSHEGILDKKLQAIEEFDREIVGPVLSLEEKFGKIRFIVLPDHKTLLSTKTHDAEEVPFAVCGSGVTTDESSTYGETSCTKYSLKLYDGVTLFNEFIKGDFS